MEFSFEAKVVLILEHKVGTDKSKHVGTKFNLNVSKNLVKEKYLDEKDLLTVDGAFVLSNTLVQGLVGNIHFCHENGFRDSAEHLRWIIAELERGFVQVTEIGQSTF